MPFLGSKKKQVSNNDEGGDDGNDRRETEVLILEDGEEDDDYGFSDLEEKEDTVPERRTSILKKLSKPFKTTPEATPEKPQLSESGGSKRAILAGEGDDGVKDVKEDKDGDMSEGADSKEKEPEGEISEDEDAGGRCPPSKMVIFIILGVLILCAVAIVLGLYFGYDEYLFGRAQGIKDMLFNGNDEEAKPVCDMCGGRGGNVTEDKRLTFLLGEDTTVTCGQVESVVLYSAKKIYEAEEEGDIGDVVDSDRPDTDNSTNTTSGELSVEPSVESVCPMVQRFGVYCGCNSFSEAATSRVANESDEEDEKEDGGDGSDPPAEGMEDCTLCGGIDAKLANPTELASSTDLATGTGLKTSCSWWDEYAIRAYESMSDSCIDSVLMASDVCRCSGGTSPPASARPTQSPVVPSPPPTPKDYCDICGGREDDGFDNVRDLSFVPLLSEAQAVVDVMTCGKLRENYDLWYQFTTSRKADFGLCDAVKELGTYCGCDTPYKESVLESINGGASDFTPCDMCDGDAAPLNPASIVSSTTLGAVMGFDPTCSFLHDFVLPLYSVKSEECVSRRVTADPHCNCPGEIVPTLVPTPSPADVPVCRGMTALYGLSLTAPPGTDVSVDGTTVSFEISLPASTRKKKRGKGNAGKKGGGGRNGNNGLLRRRTQRNTKKVKKNAQEAAKDNAKVLLGGEFGVGENMHYMCLPAYRCLLFGTADVKDGARANLGGIGWELQALRAGGSLHPGPPPPVASGLFGSKMMVGDSSGGGCFFPTPGIGDNDVDRTPPTCVLTCIEGAVERYTPPPTLSLPPNPAPTPSPTSSPTMTLERLDGGCESGTVLHDLRIYGGLDIVSLAVSSYVNVKEAGGEDVYTLTIGPDPYPEGMGRPHYICLKPNSCYTAAFQGPGYNTVTVGDKTYIPGWAVWKTVLPTPVEHETAFDIPYAPIASGKTLPVNGCTFPSDSDANEPACPVTCLQGLIETWTAPPTVSPAPTLIPTDQPTQEGTSRINLKNGGCSMKNPRSSLHELVLRDAIGRIIMPEDAAVLPVVSLAVQDEDGFDMYYTGDVGFTAASRERGYMCLPVSECYTVTVQNESNGNGIGLTWELLGYSVGSTISRYSAELIALGFLDAVGTKSCTFSPTPNMNGCPSTCFIADDNIFNIS